jgi:Tfp pilus assembly protein PilN
MLEKYYRIKQALGLSINLAADGGADISACLIAVENNKLSFEKKLTSLESIEALKRQLSGKLPVAINLSGKGILHKQVELMEDVNSGNFGKVLPNANIADFYVQHFVTGNLSFVSAIRKAEADRWIEQLQQAGFEPLMLSLGPFPVQQIMPQLNIYDTYIVFDGHRIARNEQGNWTTYQPDVNAKSMFPVKVESETIDEKLIMAYTAAFQLILSEQLSLINADVPQLQNNLAEALSTRKLKAQGAVVLGVFFILLLINFILFSHLTASNAHLAEQVSQTTQSNIDIQSIGEQIKQKESLLREMGWEGNISKSVLIDQLASLLPEEVSLTEIDVDPVDQANSRIQKTMVFFNRRISVTGTSEKIIPVNEWIARLKTRSWVKNIQIDNYTYNNELNNGQFTVMINY